MFSLLKHDVGTAHTWPKSFAWQKEVSKGSDKGEWGGGERGDVTTPTAKRNS